VGVKPLCDPLLIRPTPVSTTHVSQSNQSN
jgi:hypothetical protein